MTLQKLHRIVQTAAKQIFDLPEIPTFEVLYTNSEFGDFSTNISFKLAAQLKMSPKQIAERLVQGLSDEHFLNVTVAGNGFINMTLKDHVWIQLLSGIDTSFGCSPHGKGQKVQVEFISANPTGPLTLANARGGYLGDVLSQVLATQGYSVTREHYLNDAGGQIKKLTDSIRIEAGQEVAGDRQYNGSYIAELAAVLKPSLETSDAQLAREAVAEILKMIKAAVGRMGIRFDEWFSEASLIQDGSVEAVLSALDGKKLTYEQDGARWIASSTFGDERDRVLVKSNGEYIYLLNDIAYHLTIFQKRHFGKAIKIWGADHGGQVASLKLSVQQLVPDAELDFILLQLVHIIKDGKEFVSSKRAGTYITMDELLDEVPSDVARFFFLMRSANSQMDFDLTLAKEQSQNNPLYYVMYAYVRACSIMRKAEAKGLQAGPGTSSIDLSQKEVIRLMARWPELLGELSKTYEVHKLTHFGIEVATAFQKFYESEPIISLPPDQAAAKLFFVQQFIVFMRSYWSVMGITPLEKMSRELEA